MAEEKDLVEDVEDLKEPLPGGNVAEPPETEDARANDEPKSAEDNNITNVAGPAGRSHHMILRCSWSTIQCVCGKQMHNKFKKYHHLRCPIWRQKKKDARLLDTHSSTSSTEGKKSKME